MGNCRPVLAGATGSTKITFCASGSRLSSRPCWNTNVRIVSVATDEDPNGKALTGRASSGIRLLAAASR